MFLTLINGHLVQCSLASLSLSLPHSLSLLYICVDRERKLCTKEAREKTSQNPMSMFSIISLQEFFLHILHMIQTWILLFPFLYFIPHQVAYPFIVLESHKCVTFLREGDAQDISDSWLVINKFIMSSCTTSKIRTLLTFRQNDLSMTRLM